MISALQSLMIADTVDYEEYYTGYRPDAVFYSLQSFLSNFSGGIASIITGVAFSIAVALLSPPNAPIAGNNAE